MPRLALLAAPAVPRELPPSEKYSRESSSREERRTPFLPPLSTIFLRLVRLRSVASPRALSSPCPGYHPCFPLSTLANITRINRRAAKWRGERCGRRRGLSAPITGCLSSPNDSIKTARKRTGQRMDARGFACYFEWRIFFSSANFDMQSISLRTMSFDIAFGRRKRRLNNL